MAEEVVLMKGNEAIPHATIRNGPNLKYWKRLPSRSRGKLPEW